MKEKQTLLRNYISYMSFCYPLPWKVKIVRVLIIVVVMRTKGDNVCKDLNTVLTKLLHDEVNSESKCLISQHNFFFKSIFGWGKIFVVLSYFVGIY